jgi:Fur family transcriptional regulator, ferric uptake regulator
MKKANGHYCNWIAIQAAIITQQGCVMMNNMCAANTLSPTPATALPPEWQARLERAGLRRTHATMVVLGLFLQDRGWNPTHAEVDAQLTQLGEPVNRVTLYRLLDRLAASGLLERHADADSRLWRFRLADTETDPLAPRFECDACHRQFRVTEASQTTRAATDQLLNALAHLGHHGQRVDLAIHGTCAVCVEPDADHLPLSGH